MRTTSTSRLDIGIHETSAQSTKFFSRAQGVTRRRRRPCACMCPRDSPSPNLNCFKFGRTVFRYFAGSSPSALPLNFTKTFLPTVKLSIQTNLGLSKTPSTSEHLRGAFITNSIYQLLFKSLREFYWIVAAMFMDFRLLFFRALSREIWLR